MLDSVTILSKSGMVLYHRDLQQQSTNNNEKSETTATTNQRMSTSSQQILNTFISTILLDPGRISKLETIKRTTISIQSSSSSVVEWENASSSSNNNNNNNNNTKNQTKIPRDWIVVALYPEVILRHGTLAHVQHWIKPFLKMLLKEYALFYHHTTTSNNNNVYLPPSNEQQLTFDAVFTALLHRSETMGRQQQQQGAGMYDAPQSIIHNNNNNEEEESMNDDKNTLRQRGGRQQLPKKSTTTPKKKGKEKTVWHDGLGKVTAESMAALDMSKKKNDDGSATSQPMNSIDAVVAEDSRALAEARAAYLPSQDDDDDDNNDAFMEPNFWLQDNEDNNTSSSSQKNGWGTSLRGIFDSITGNKVLTVHDLEPPLSEMQRQLTSKNVALDIAQEICDSVKRQLIGKRMQSFARVKTAVRTALEISIQNILSHDNNTTNKSVDVLHSVITKRERQRNNTAFGLVNGLFTDPNNKQNKKQQQRPYVIVMIGINGVGKSTSLAKIAYHLKSNGCHPLLAACDTFRSGAVEQLNVHAKCLDVPLFHRGYAKDPSSVAKMAIDFASQSPSQQQSQSQDDTTTTTQQQQQHDVVLIDTAGRMQNNVPLMRALSKLVVENKPDLVLFVCEALVGNDGMDQLHMFDRALQSGGHSRSIDGIVLTKFDTVSDKVGAALTLTHRSGVPVVYVGTGQKYNHLKELSVPQVMQSLFS